jgi:hypothetical protein
MAIAPIHDRIPGILGRDNWSAWLGEIEANQDNLLRMLRPCPSHLMPVYPVDKRVGSVQGWAVADSQVCWRKTDGKWIACDRVRVTIAALRPLLQVAAPNDSGLDSLSH